MDQSSPKRGAWRAVLPIGRRHDEKIAAASERDFVGLYVSAGGREISAAVLAVAGRGLSARPRIASFFAMPTPDETVSLLASVTASRTQVSAATIAAITWQLAEAQAVAVREVIVRGEIDSERPLAVGVCDPGLWSDSGGGARGYLPIGGAARLAELTGHNVIDGFAERDLAHGGQGGPLDALAQWVLLHNERSSRVLVDLGRATRMTYLPSPAAGGAERVLSFDVGPGGLLLDQLAERLTDGGQRFDAGGRLAVQGRCIAELLEHWLSDPYFKRPLPRWQPRGVAPERFLSEAMQMALDRGWTVRDLLCTANHFIAETISRAIAQQLNFLPTVAEVVLVGRGQRNGLLQREVTSRLPRGVSNCCIGGLGEEGRHLRPACAALLAMLHIDQTPANHAKITGTHAPRVLGRITPGRPHRWGRLLQEMAANVPQPVGLRSAM